MAIFGAGEAIKQSVGALSAVVVIMAADLMCHPYVKEIYDTLEEVLAFVEFMVLLLGLVALAQPEPGGWHETTAWIMMVGAFMMIAYVACTDLRNVWQLRRTRKLTSHLKITVSPSLFQINAFDSVLVDWLGQTLEDVSGDFENDILDGLSFTTSFAGLNGNELGH